MKVIGSAFIGCLAAGCVSAGSDTKAAMPNLSIAWDAGEALRHVFTEGCLKAVELNRPIKVTIDRGVVLSRVRPLDASPLKGDPPGTPAFAVISGASVIMTGTGERCSVASSSGEGQQLRAILLEVLDKQQTGWQTLASPTNPDPSITMDMRCRPVQGGVMAVQMITAPGKPTPLIAIVFRSKQSACSVG